MKALLTMTVLTLLLLGFGCSSSSDTDDPDPPAYPEIEDLVVFYPFDGDLENAVADEHHGTAERSLVYVEDHLGNADGAVHVTTEVILVPDHPDLDITGAITLAAWVKPDVSNHALCAVVDKNYQDAYTLGMHGWNGPSVQTIRAYIGDYGFYSDAILPFGQEVWSHIAFSYDETTQWGKFYMNGEAVDSTHVALTIGVNDIDLHIGEAYWGDRYKGAIDNLAIFSRALTDQEVVDLYEFE